jgi:hypothetical protein
MSKTILHLEVIQKIMKIPEIVVPKVLMLHNQKRHASD